MTPGATSTTSPASAITWRRPTRKRIRPATTSNRSVWIGWTCGIGTAPPGLQPELEGEQLAAGARGGVEEREPLAGDGVLERLPRLDGRAVKVVAGGHAAIERPITETVHGSRSADAYASVHGRLSRPRARPPARGRARSAAPAPRRRRRRARAAARGPVRCGRRRARTRPSPRRSSCAPRGSCRAGAGASTARVRRAGRSRRSAAGAARRTAPGGSTRRPRSTARTPAASAAKVRVSQPLSSVGSSSPPCSSAAAATASPPVSFSAVTPATRRSSRNWSGVSVTPVAAGRL